MRFPACGFLPQISHCCAMTTPGEFKSCRANLNFTGTCPDRQCQLREKNCASSPSRETACLLMFRLCVPAPTSSHSPRSTVEGRRSRPESADPECEFYWTL